MVRKLTDAIASGPARVVISAAIPQGAHAMIMRYKEIKDIPLDKIHIGTAQARVRDVGRGIQELAESIRKIGLLEPIVVQEAEAGNYEVITGQRRFLAQKLLNEKGSPDHGMIKACILATRLDADMAKAVSLTENMMREDMVTKDYIDACTALYRRYGSIKAVSEELGLPVNKVTAYVKYEQLPKKLKDLMQTDAIDLTTALRANKAAMDEYGSINEDKAEAFAKEMSGMSGVQQKAFEAAAGKNKGATVEQIIEEGRKQTNIKQIVVVLAGSTDEALVKFAQEEKTSKDEAASGLIEGGLISKGYL